MPILQPIKPQYCELIASGKKTIEVRKTRPKCELPVKVYIYETKTADLLVGVIGLCGEAGETADLVKKIVFHQHPMDVEALKKELGDVMWCVAMCCNVLNIALDEVMQGNIEKLKRRYPDGFSTDASINRTE